MTAIGDASTEGKAPARSKANRRRVAVVLTLVVLAMGALLFKGLGDATVYFLTAYEAVDQKAELGTRRFRVEGLVTDSVRPVGGAVEFEIVSAGVRVPVRHKGDPPELFKPDIPVVLEGRWSDDGSRFESDEIMVKHTNEYREQNPDRTADYVGREQ
jgi:cytochrome c-type biogenesis protein CcmE